MRSDKSLSTLRDWISSNNIHPGWVNLGEAFGNRVEEEDKTPDEYRRIIRRLEGDLRLEKEACDIKLRQKDHAIAMKDKEIERLYQALTAAKYFLSMNEYDRAELEIDQAIKEE